MKKTTQTLRKLIRRTGFDLYRIKSKTQMQTQLEFALSVKIGSRESLNIVQVGANDGQIADPIYKFASEHSRRTHLLLIEPQTSLHPFLLQSYKGHPNIIISDKAIGPPGTVCLYAVRSECWQDCDAPYGRDWPSYRAPTGVTSTSREHVVRWVTRYYRGSLPISEVIEVLAVESIPLVALLERHQFKRPVDLLQVDAEGYDDQVIYHSSVDLLRPALINFEHTSLEKHAADTLSSYLQNLGYLLTPNGNDTLCVRMFP